MSDKEINLVIVTGMSGAGKTVAIQSFEDLGYFTIDNILGILNKLVQKILKIWKIKQENLELVL